MGEERIRGVFFIDGKIGGIEVGIWSSTTLTNSNEKRVLFSFCLLFFFFLVYDSVEPKLIGVLDD